jgi:hypothetical protein
MSLDRARMLLRRPPTLSIDAQTFSAFRSLIRADAGPEALSAISGMSPALALAAVLRLQTPCVRTGRFTLKLSDIYRRKANSTLTSFANAELVSGRVGHVTSCAGAFDRMCRHSAFVGTMAAEVAQNMGLEDDAESVMVLGLLHDLGTIMLSQVDPATFRAIMEFSITSGVTFEIGCLCMHAQSPFTLGVIAAEALSLDQQVTHMLSHLDEEKLQDATHVEVVIRICDWFAGTYGYNWEPWASTSEVPSALMRSFTQNRDLYENAAKVAVEKIDRISSMIQARRAA